MFRYVLLVSLISCSFFAAGCQEEQEDNSSESNETNQAEVKTNEDKLDNAQHAAEEESKKKEENEVNEKDQVQENKPTNDKNSNVSSVASGEDNTEYYKSLAVPGENQGSIPEEIVENLELPGIHENTIIYNGKISPDQTARFEFPNKETISPVVSPEGHFSLSLEDQNFSEGETIRLYISGDFSSAQAFDLPVHAEQADKQVIFSSTDTGQLEEALKQEIDMPAVYSEQRMYEGTAAGSIDAVHTLKEESVSENIYENYDQREGGHISAVLEEAPSKDEITTFFIVGKGITAKVDKKHQNLTEEEQAAVQSIEEETEWQGSFLPAKAYELGTIKNAVVTMISENNPSAFIKVEADEEGRYTVPLEDLRTTTEEETIFIKIEDDQGHSLVMERTVTAEL